MAAGGGFGDAAGGRSSNQRSPMAGRSAPPLRPPHGRSLSSRGGFSAARAAVMRCAHGRLAQRLRTGRAVVAMGVGRKRSGEQRMTAVRPCCSGQRRRRLSATDGSTRTWPGKGCAWPLRRRTAVEKTCDFQFGNSRACARAASACCQCEMGPPNPVCYVGTKAPGSPGFS